MSVFSFDEERESERSMNEATGFYEARMARMSREERKADMDDFMSSLRDRAAASGMRANFETRPREDANDFMSSVRDRAAASGMRTRNFDRK